MAGPRRRWAGVGGRSQQGTLYETFSEAELKTLMTDENIRTSIEQRLVRDVVGDKD